MANFFSLFLQHRNYIYSLVPDSTTSPQLIYTFLDVTDLLGIVETTPDVFILVAGNLSLSLPLATTPGSYSAWKIDFNSDGSTPQISKVTDMPEATFLNGVEILPSSLQHVLISDSDLGLVWKLDTVSREYEISLNILEVKIPAGAEVPIGINGLHIWEEYLYFINSQQFTFYRIQINRNGVAVPGAEAEVVYVSGGFEDDFIFDKDGTVWITTDPEDTVLVIESDGVLETVVGSIYQETVAGRTACRFGRRLGSCGWH